MKTKINIIYCSHFVQTNLELDRMHWIVLSLKFLTQSGNAIYKQGTITKRTITKISAQVKSLSLQFHGYLKCQVLGQSSSFHSPAELFYISIKST